MLYDGIDLGNNLCVLECPKCKNEEFSKDCEFCRICGSRVYNKCEGEWDDRDQYLIQHNNPGNARFCESCGKPTYFLKENFLKTWDKVQITEDGEDFLSLDEVAATSDEFEISNSATNDGDLPF